MSLNWADLYSNSAVFSEGIAAFFAILFSKYLHDKRLFIFTIILIIIFCVELCCGTFTTNYWKPLIYNLLAIFTFLGYSYIFFKKINDVKYKNIIKCCVVVYLLSVLANCSYVNIHDKSHQYSYFIV